MHSNGPAELEAEQEALRSSLKGLDRVWLTGPAFPSPRPVELPLRRAFNGVASENAGFWGPVFAALQSNPEAELP